MMIKKILAISLIWIIGLCIVHADDCILSIGQTKENILGDRDLKEYSQAFPADAIEKALDNLRTYCCKEKVIGAGCENMSDLYPESIYLFDHILDVYLRRLDAVGEYENLGADEDGKIWRDFIIGHGDNKDGSLPLEIKNKYGDMRSTDQVAIDRSIIYGNAKSDRMEKIKNAIANFDTWKLWDKYSLACDVAVYINDDLNGDKVLDSEYNLCKTMIKNRINNEFVYTKSILMQKANTLLSDNIKSYLNKYLENKLSELQKTIFDINSMFAEINRAVKQLTASCS